MTTSTSTRTDRLVDLREEFGHHLTHLGHSLKMRLHEARTKGDKTTQGHLTITFPMKSRRGTDTLRDEFPTLVMS
jgi:hypothetical protein